MAVLNADTGAVVATPAICTGIDATWFDPGTGYVFNSCGDGTLTVIHEDSPDKYSLVENVMTKRGARTMAVDMKTHNVYLAMADLEAPPADKRRRRRAAVAHAPESFRHISVARVRALMTGIAADAVSKEHLTGPASPGVPGKVDAAMSGLAGLKLVSPSHTPGHFRRNQFVPSAPRIYPPGRARGHVRLP